MKILPKTSFLILATLVIASMLLSSCGTATEAPSGTDQEAITLNLWTFEGEESVFPDLISQFEADYPNITVELTLIPESDYTTKIDTALIAGEPPDVGYVYEAKWIKAGEFLPIDDVIAEQGINMADYNQGALEQSCIIDGKVYCLGTYMGAIMLFYNKDLFDQAGVAYPSSTEPMSMDEYVDMCATLTQKSDVLEDKVWGCDADIPIWWHDPRNYFSDDGLTVIGYTNDDATIHTFEKLAQLREDGSVIGDMDSQSLEGTDLMATGQLATTIVDNVVAISTLEEAGINWGAALVPVEQKGDQAWVSTWTDNFGVFSDSKHPQEAKLFIAYMGTKGNEIRLDMGHLPLNMILADQWAGESTGRQEVAAAIKLARPGIFIPVYWDVVGLLWDAFYGDILEDGRPVPEVMDEYAPLMQEILDQAWETWNSIK